MEAHFCEAVNRIYRLPIRTDIKVAEQDRLNDLSMLEEIDESAKKIIPIQADLPIQTRKSA
jgi:hypothetical protein